MLDCQIEFVARGLGPQPNCKIVLLLCRLSVMNVQYRENFIAKEKSGYFVRAMMYTTKYKYFLIHIFYY